MYSTQFFICIILAQIILFVGIDIEMRNLFYLNSLMKSTFNLSYSF